ncbi:flagellar hook-basal body complex protein [Primorskyibacter sp. S187A]|uniref:flagellar hook-basal body complex protein n=1 Tax=Primorskyibacter sp. S187A TaxID=3415130 RepID=UPI003C79FAC7
MDNAGYTTLTRQSGLMREMQVVANNIANSATTGFRSEGIMFSEHVNRIDGGASLSMASANVKNTSMEQGALTKTGGQLDFAIEGEGFFLINTPAGERLTRSGSFSLSAAGDLVTHDGFAVLDAGGAPLFVPPDATDLSVSADGTMSADGRLIGQLGVVRPVDMTDLSREDGVMFRTDAGFEADPESRIVQGFVENSNVNPMAQIARMIEVQRAYEMGQSFMESEHERIKTAIQTFIKRG